MIYIGICIFLLLLIIFINVIYDFKETFKLIFISFIYGLLLVSLIFLNKIAVLILFIISSYFIYRFLIYKEKFFYKNLEYQISLFYMTSFSVILIKYNELLKFVPLIFMLSIILYKDRILNRVKILEYFIFTIVYFLFIYTNVYIKFIFLIILFLMYLKNFLNYYILVSQNNIIILNDNFYINRKKYNKDKDIINFKGE